MNEIAGDARVQHEACSKGEEIGVGIHGGGQVMVVEEEEGKEKSSLKSLLSAVNAALNPLLQHMRRKRCEFDLLFYNSQSQANWSRKNGRALPAVRGEISNTEI